MFNQELLFKTYDCVNDQTAKVPRLEKKIDALIGQNEALIQMNQALLNHFLPQMNTAVNTQAMKKSGYDKIIDFAPMVSTQHRSLAPPMEGDVGPDVITTVLEDTN